MKLCITLLLAALSAAIISLASHNARMATQIEELETRLAQTNDRLDQIEASRTPRPELLKLDTGAK